MLIQPAKTFRKEPGTLPGSLIYTGSIEGKSVLLSLIRYDENSYEDFTDDNIENLLSKFDEKKFNWLNIDGLFDADTIEKTGNYFNLHPLVLEDIMDAEHLPKFEEFDDYLFFTTKMLLAIQPDNELLQEHISFILGKNFIITFQEKPGDIFDIIRSRLQSPNSKIRKRKTDYLFYQMIDLIIDHYFVILDKLGDKIEDLEDQLLNNISEQIAGRILVYKKQMMFLKKTIFPLREEIVKLNRIDSDLIDDTTTKYFNDVHDHMIQIIQVMDNFQESLNSLMELYVSNYANKMNNIMMTLTVITSIFIPLTFVAGVYGMNFRYMPELEWRYGYFIIVGLMAFIGVSMYVWMKRKRWL